jgi:predicted phage tail protein
MVKRYNEFIKEEYGSEIKNKLADVIDVDKRKKDVTDINNKIDSTNDEIIKKKKDLELQITKLEQLETSDYTPENKKLLKDKIDKYKEDIRGLDDLIKTFKQNIAELKK